MSSSSSSSSSFSPISPGTSSRSAFQSPLGPVRNGELPDAKRAKRGMRLWEPKPEEESDEDDERKHEDEDNDNDSDEIEHDLDTELYGDRAHVNGDDLDGTAKNLDPAKVHDCVSLTVRGEDAGDDDLYIIPLAWLKRIGRCAVGLLGMSHNDPLFDEDDMKLFRSRLSAKDGIQIPDFKKIVRFINVAPPTAKASPEELYDAEEAGEEASEE